jgi:hypothetical protein
MRPNRRYEPYNNGMKPYSSTLRITQGAPVNHAFVMGQPAIQNLAGLVSKNRGEVTADYEGYLAVDYPLPPECDLNYALNLALSEIQKAGYTFSPNGRLQAIIHSNSKQKSRLGIVRVDNRMLILQVFTEGANFAKPMVTAIQQITLEQII